MTGKLKQWFVTVVFKEYGNDESEAKEKILEGLRSGKFIRFERILVDPVMDSPVACLHYIQPMNGLTHKTMCGYVVTSDTQYAIDPREVTCPDCRKVIKESWEVS